MKIDKIDTSSIDWSMTNPQIAKILGVDSSTVFRLRKKLGIEQAQSRPRIEFSDWRSLDWEEKNDRQIAEELGCSSSVIALKRREYARHLKRPRHISCAWGNQDWTLPNATIAQQRGVKESSVAVARNRHGKGIKFPRKARITKLAVMEAKLSERKTVHQWLNGLWIPSSENEKPICLLRRLRILCDSYQQLIHHSSHP